MAIIGERVSVVLRVARKPVQRLCGLLGLGFIGLLMTAHPVSLQDVVTLSGQKVIADRWRASIVHNPARFTYQNEAGETVYAKRLILDKTTLMPVNGLSIGLQHQFIGAVLAPTPDIAKVLSTGKGIPLGAKTDRFLTPREERLKLARQDKTQENPSLKVAFHDWSLWPKRIDPLLLAIPKPKARPKGLLKQRVAIDKTVSGSILQDDPRTAYASNAVTESPKAVFEAVLGETNPSRLHPETPLSAPFEAEAAIALPKIKPEVVATAEPGPDKKKKQHFWAYFKLPRSTFKKSQQRCLAAAIYFEARGEIDEGQAAVAQVVLNRVKNPTYPKTICGVVYQNKHKRNRCQFSFACDGIYDRIKDEQAWAKAVKIAEDVTKGRIYLKKVGDSTHYHATYVHPNWARKMKVVDRIGVHIFYRTKKGGWI